MIRIKPAAVAALSAGLACGGALAAGDAERGQALSATCAACHGADGMAQIDLYPNLAGQNAKYLENALKAYREGRRTGGTAALMTPMAKQLDDQQIADLAAYYASLAPQGAR